MVLSLLNLPPKRWSELLKVTQRFPRSEEEYRAIKQQIVKESAMERSVASLQRASVAHGGATHHSFFSSPEVPTLTPSPSTYAWA
eukprot:9140807-Karenia_brevis.AAC.1